MELLWKDVRYALRQLAKSPGFALVAVLTLALGIGANTAIFSIVNAVFLRPLPFPDANRIYLLQRSGNRIGGASISLPIYIAWLEKQNLFDAMGVVDGLGQMTLAGGDEPKRYPALAVTPDVFAALGVQPALGRTFSADEGKPGGPNVIVLSNAIWRTRFASDPGVVGRAITLGNHSYNVIGVLPEGFEIPIPFMRDAQVWLPYQTSLASDNSSNGLWCIGRLRNDVSRAAAEAALTVPIAGLSARFPSMILPVEKAHLVPMREFLRARAGSAPLLLLGAVGLILLIACANVANLLLARATNRRREVALRTALGASRGQIVRQLLTESALLGLAGGAAGVLLCYACFGLILTLVPTNLPHVGAIGIDALVLMFAVALSLLTGVVFGLAPALSISKTDVSTALKEGTSRAGTGRDRGRMRAALVVSEVGLALVLLTGAALLLESFGKLLGVNLGFNPDHTLVFSVSLPRAAYDTPAKSVAFFDEFAARLEATPGVKEVAYISGLPLASAGDILFSIEGRSAAEEDKGDADFRIASANYFETMGIPLLSGRGFNAGDSAGAEPVVLINRTMAEEYWPHRDAIGAFIWIGKPMGPANSEPAPRRIVGIVGDVHGESPASAPSPAMYRPPAQAGGGVNGSSFVVRTAQDPLALEPTIRGMLRSALPSQPVSAMRTMDQIVSGSLRNQRFQTILLGLFAGIGLLLVTVGVYGVVSYLVVQRTHEIGVRMALGATQANVLRMVLWQGARMAAIGILVGLAASFWVTRLLESMLYEVRPNDLLTLASVALFLLAVVLAGCYLPARRAMRVDPMIALRYE
jgi:putative ABC transport system permease protein